MRNLVFLFINGPSITIKNESKSNTIIALSIFIKYRTGQKKTLGNVQNILLLDDRQIHKW